MYTYTDIDQEVVEKWRKMIGVRTRTKGLTELSGESGERNKLARKKREDSSQRCSAECRPAHIKHKGWAYLRLKHRACDGVVAIEGHFYELSEAG